MKILIKVGLLFIFFASCSPCKYSSRDVQGVYKQKDNSNFKLTLSENRFTYVDAYANDLALYTCCDTITTGVWVKEKDLLCLSTPQIKSSILNIDVKENSNKKGDTIFFYLKNPVETYHKNFQVKNRHIYYTIFLEDKQANFFKETYQKFDSDIIKVYKPQGVVLDNFSINVYPSINFGGRNIGIREVSTIKYQVKDSTSNLFEVSIPQLNYEFMTYLRLDRDFIRVINKNKLEWDGHFYIKESLISF
jgi:hypothetical protein